jgi:2-oxoglutarate dehydrogenase E2 component (dihydrolipoamide succinyltransferase)
MTDIRVPTLGESVTEATVATWFKKAGDPVKADEMLCELETDKVTVEVPAPASGVLAEIVAKEGETVGVDALLATLDEKAQGKAAPAKAAAAKAESKAPAKTETAGKTAPDDAESAPDNEQAVEIMVPTLGESVTEATVSTWFKKVGDNVTQDEMLCELETDKVSVEVPSPASGVLAEIYADDGATVQAGGKLGRIGGSSTAGAAASARKEEPAVATSDEPAPRRDVEDAPSAKKLMAEKGIGPGSIEGSGRDGRVMKEDVLRSEAPSPVPFPAPAPEPSSIPRSPVLAEDAAREERVKMTRLRQTIARRLKEAQNTAAILTTYNEVDMSGVMGLRNEYKDLFEKKHGVKLGFMSFFTRACCHALKEVPEVNAEIDGTDVVYKNFVHMGIAVGTPSGLVVPVVRDADQMSFAAIEKKINELGARARDGKLSMADMQGGTFTISNGGVYGSLMSSPILNPPQSGILGMHKIQERPMVIKGEIKIRPMMYLALSYDHRIVDGKGAVTFLVRVKEALEDPRRLLMDL